MSVPSQVYVRDVQLVVADFVKNAEGDSMEFNMIVLRVHQKVQPGKRKPSLSHKKRVLDAVKYEVNAYRLSIDDQDDPHVVTITPTGSTYYFDLATSSVSASEKRRVTKKNAIADYRAAAAILEPIKDTLAEYASMDPLIHCVESLPGLILQTLELEFTLQDQNAAMLIAEADLAFEFDLIHNGFLP